MFGARVTNKPPAILKLIKEKDRSDEVFLQEAVSSLRASFNSLDVIKRRLDKGVSSRSNRMIAHTMRESEVREADGVWLKMALDLANMGDSSDSDAEERTDSKGSNANMSASDSSLVGGLQRLPDVNFDMEDTEAEILCQQISDVLDSCGRAKPCAKRRPATAPGTGRQPKLKLTNFQLQTKGPSTRSDKQALDTNVHGRGAQPVLTREMGSGKIQKDSPQYHNPQGLRPVSSSGLADGDFISKGGLRGSLRTSYSMPGGIGQGSLPSNALTSGECAKRRPQWSKMYDGSSCWGNTARFESDRRMANADRKSVV